MRVNRYIVIIISTLIFSCSDFTNIQPDHSLTANNAFKTMADLELHLNGVYSAFQGTGYFALAYGTLPDMMSDNLTENVESLGNYRSVVDWLYVANDGIVAGYGQRLTALSMIVIFCSATLINSKNQKPVNVTD